MSSRANSIRLALRPRLFNAFLTVLLIAVAVELGLLISQAKWLYVGALSFGLLILLYPVQMSLGVFGSLLPFDNISILGNSSSTLTFLLGAASGAVLLGIGLAGGRLQRPPRAAFWWTLLVLWGAASTLWALNPQFAFEQLRSSVAVVLLYVVAVSLRFTDDELDWVVLLAIIGACGAALFAIYAFVQGRFYVEMRGSLMIGDRETNPNYLAASLLLPLSLAVGRLIETRQRGKRCFLYCAIITIAAGLLVTMSRGALLATAVMMLVYFYRYHTNWRQLLVTFVLLLSLLALMPDYFFARWKQAAETGGAGRLDIWQAGLWALRNHLVLGAGLGNFPIVYTDFAGYAPRFAGFGRDAHNTYLGVATELGMVGFLLFLAGLFSQLRAAAKASRTNRPAPLVVAVEGAYWAILVAGMFGNLIWQKTFWFTSMLLMVILQLEKSRQSVQPTSAKALGNA
jgi:O-antigen ligase